MEDTMTLRHNNIVKGIRNRGPKITGYAHEKCNEGSENA